MQRVRLNSTRMRRRSLVILWVIWLAGAMSRTEAASGGMWDDMDREGFDIVGMPADYLPLPHNSAEAINAELNSEELRKRLANVIHADLTLIERCQFQIRSEQKDVSDYLKNYPEERTYMLALTTRWFLWAKRDGVPKELFERIQEKLVRYVNARVAGHTKDYAIDSMAEPPRRAGETPTLRAKVLDEFPAVPAKWLLDTTNTFGSLWYRPPKDTDPRVTPPLEQHEPVPLTNHIFKVVDGPVTWEYSAADNRPFVDVEKHDSQEDDPNKSKFIREARKEVDAWMQQKGFKGKFGSVHTYWPELKRVLKEKYSIDWLSPKDLHPNRNYD